eukprot:TRINITY_DN11180_c0_g1_i1.p1 TRINITY_DN11180_c0_g1~~TRINITY_DN11180_c0_g1_i1.p1  ORF type:complete len:197 (+),score=30.44 TRINITY_DN11180_c0_g1_i1:155-745(+)
MESFQPEQVGAHEKSRTTPKLLPEQQPQQIPLADQNVAGFCRGIENEFLQIHGLIDIARREATELQQQKMHYMEYYAYLDREFSKQAGTNTKLLGLFSEIIPLLPEEMQEEVKLQITEFTDLSTIMPTTMQSSGFVPTRPQMNGFVPVTNLQPTKLVPVPGFMPGGQPEPQTPTLSTLHDRRMSSPDPYQALFNTQ